MNKDIEEELKGIRERNGVESETFRKAIEGVLKDGKAIKFSKGKNSVTVLYNSRFQIFEITAVSDELFFGFPPEFLKKATITQISKITV